MPSPRNHSTNPRATTVVHQGKTLCRALRAWRDWTMAREDSAPPSRNLLVDPGLRKIGLSTPPEVPVSRCGSGTTSPQIPITAPSRLAGPPPLPDDLAHELPSEQLPPDFGPDPHGPGARPYGIHRRSCRGTWMDTSVRIRARRSSGAQCRAAGATATRARATHRLRRNSCTRDSPGGHGLAL